MQHDAFDRGFLNEFFKEANAWLIEDGIDAAEGEWLGDEQVLFCQQEQCCVCFLNENNVLFLNNSSAMSCFFLTGTMSCVC